ncbi:MAG: hydantoinase/oxoprolinase family protein, partial [Gaiellales bacterium]
FPVTISSDVLPEFREYERTLAAVANAYVQPAMAEYLDRLEQELADRLPGVRLAVVRSDGGLMSPGDASSRPVETVFSGPAGGVRASVHLGELVGVRRVLSFDMGGTSTDVALSRDGQAAVARTSSLTEYFRVRVPSLDVISIGAGGGSIAHVPMTGALRVGPESAGSSPGPACYGRGGTDVTVTDANVVLGYLPSLLGGRMPLHRDRALESLSALGEALGAGPEDAARAVITIANEKMLSGLRLVSLQRGHDPREFALVAFGGAGPLHANALMDLIGSQLCVIPPAPGVFSTYGFLIADVQREFARSCIRRVSKLEASAVAAVIDELATRGASWLEREGFEPSERRLEWSFGMRYHRQGYELPVHHPDPAGDPDLLQTLAQGFVAAHRQTYGFDLDIEVELVVARCIAIGITPTPLTMPAARGAGGVEEALVEAGHTIYWQGEWVEAPRYDRRRLAPGHDLIGPCVIEQEDSTTLVHPQTHVSVDGFRNLLMERVAA